MARTWSNYLFITSYSNIFGHTFVMTQVYYRHYQYVHFPRHLRVKLNGYRGGRNMLGRKGKIHDEQCDSSDQYVVYGRVFTSHSNIFGLTLVMTQVYYIYYQSVPFFRGTIMPSSQFNRVPRKGDIC